MRERFRKVTLLPCPFCGCKEIKRDILPWKAWVVYCTNQKCSAVLGFNKSPRQVSEAWNTRVK